MTNPTQGLVRVQEFAPALNAQFRGAEPAGLLHAAGDWLEARPDASVVALNLTQFDLLGTNPHGGGFLLDLVVDQGAREVGR